MQRVPKDVILYYIVPHLNVQDLSRLMQANRYFFQFLICDQAWEHLKRRVLGVTPFLQDILFDKYPFVNHENRQKRRRVEKTLCIPQGGTWFVFQQYICHARSVECLQAFVDFANIERWFPHNQEVSFDRNTITAKPESPYLKQMAVLIFALFMTVNDRVGNFNFLRDVLFCNLFRNSQKEMIHRVRWLRASAQVWLSVYDGEDSGEHAYKELLYF